MSAIQDTKKLPSISLGRSAGLVMTDYWFLFGMWLVVFWAIDPLGWKIDFIPIIKHFPVFVIAPAFVLAAFGRRLFPWENSSVYGKEMILNISFLVVAFSVFVTTGSLIARFLNNIENSFLTMGLFILMVPLTAWFIRGSVNPDSLIKKLVLIYIFWALVSVVLQAVNFGEREVFHAREHLVISALIFFYLIAEGKIGKFIALVLLVFSAIIARKNSAYLTVLLLLSFVFFVWAIQRSLQIRDSMLRSMFWVKIILLGMCGMAGVAFAYFNRGATSPTGNPEYRLHTYELAWNKFMASPLWGTAFTGAATEKFEKFSVAVSTQVLPTHSDPLDILAHGGLIGFVLWAGIFVLLFKCWYLLIIKSDQYIKNDLMPYLNTIFYMVFSGVLVCMFNPVLNTPNLAWSFWALVGALLAILKSPIKIRSSLAV